jgi:prepilin-type N-terminal cleavage/methylation domain-containing protein
MKKSVGQPGFTLIEVLVVVGVIVVLYMMLIPAIAPRKNPALQVRCMSNQRQVELGYLMWNSDNGGQFPWHVSTVTNGTMELITNGLASAQFLALNPYIKYAGVYVCPADKSREMATNLDTLSNHNLSYFVDVDATASSAPIILTGDRNLIAGGKPVAPGLFQYTNTMAMDWTRELHSTKTAVTRGILGFADGHAQVVQGKDLDGVFKGQGLVGARLEVP